MHRSKRPVESRAEVRYKVAASFYEEDRGVSAFLTVTAALAYEEEEDLL